MVNKLLKALYVYVGIQVNEFFVVTNDAFDLLHRRLENAGTLLIQLLSKKGLHKRPLYHIFLVGPRLPPQRTWAGLFHIVYCSFINQLFLTKSFTQSQ